MTPGEKILVTGAGGFTGKHFIAAARQQGFDCTGAYQFESDAAEASGAAIAVDLLDREGLIAAVKDIRPNYVVHLAAMSFVAHGDTAEIYRVNLLGTTNLLDALRQSSGNLQKVLIASSANIYGNAQVLPITEHTAVNPLNHYGVSKHAMEMAAKLYHDLPLTIVRPFNYTGQGQHANFLIPKIVAAYRERSAELLLGNLDVSRDFSDVRDVVAAYLALLLAEGSGDVFNVCSGIATPLVGIIEALNRLSGLDMKIAASAEFKRGNEILTLYGSPEKLEGKIGPYRSHQLEQTLEWMLNASS